MTDPGTAAPLRDQVAYLRQQVVELKSKQANLERLVSEHASMIRELASGLEQKEPTATVTVEFQPTEEQRQRVAALQKEIWAIIREIPAPTSQGGTHK